ncbi:MAG: hypothetical protein IPJ34_15190 [Myxococcales bacterium]|nr:hypothetical protein [Myxococcales bacterium]MBL8716325.1 hypothetical protein [Myxococcales bacterium]
MVRAPGTRDSLYGEPVARVFRPVPAPPTHNVRVGAWMLGALALVTTCFAVTVVRILHVPIGSMLLIAGWLAIVAVGVYLGPGWWRREVEVVLTSKHVIWRRGRLRRSIDRRAITYARILWHPTLRGVGDLELVRAVAMGPLRRTLSITLPDLEAPDAVWAEIRGVDPTRALGDGGRPVGQRLDRGERLLWTARPDGPGWDLRRVMTLGIALVAFVVSARALLGGIHALHAVYQAGVRPASLSGGALVLALAVSIGAVMFTGVLAAWHALVRPQQLVLNTRYVVTDRRVLIQRGKEELLLDRDRIVDVIDAPSDHGRRDLFLVVGGGKNAHAHALAGAFGEKVQAGALLPVLRAVVDSDTVRDILVTPRAA